MNYNHFTINYISAIKKNLKIEIVCGEVMFFPDNILLENITNLKSELQEIWKDSESSITILKNCQDAKIQLGLFGIINDFDLALKTGYLLGDRIVVIDYIFERILNKKPFDKININILGELGVNLVSTLELAEKGRFVIIPSPFGWNTDSKKIIAETTEKTTMTPELMSLLNMLSITKTCQLHPYTIAESSDNYDRIVSSEINHTDAMGKTTEDYAYQGILSGLLTEKLINEAEFQSILKVPLNEYIKVIELQQNFYTEFKKKITFGGALNANSNIEELKTEIFNLINERNKNIYKKILEKTGVLLGVFGAGITVLGPIVLLSPYIATTGAFLGLSGTLLSLFKGKELAGNPVINVFSKFIKK